MNPHLTHPRDATSLLNVAALDTGFNTTLFAGGILLASIPSSEQALSFAGDIPASTTQGTAALLSERDYARRFLHDAGAQVVAHTSLRFDDDAAYIGHVADQVGYPARVSPVWASKRSRRIDDSAALRQEVEQLASIAGPRRTRRNHPRARFMLEHDAGQALLDYGIAHGRVLFRLIDGSPTEASDVATELDDFALRVMSLVPGIEVGRVRFEVAEPLSAVTSHTCALLDVSPKVRLDTLRAAHPSIAERAATDIVALEAQGQQITSPTLGSRSGARITAHGVALPETGVRDLSEYCTETDPRIENFTSDESTVSADIPPDPSLVDDLQQALVHGGVGSMRPLYVDAQWQP